jgi:E3 ubiquitin-protein ligase makorin
LHPTDLDRNEKHIEECLSSQAPPSSPFSATNGTAGPNDNDDLECGICYEPVKQKSDPRFGLLTCEHVFCLQCIRTWRAKHSQTTADNLRSCPMCRTLTYFVTPSTEWVSDQAKKTKVIDDYKKNLGQIPCAYFNYGDGSCPFGSSCFYAHRHRDGSEAEPERIRAYFDSNEQVKAVRETKLSDFVQFSLTQNRKSNNNNKK